MKPKFWTMLLLAGLATQPGIRPDNGKGDFSTLSSFTTQSGVTIFSLATLYLLLGTIAGIFDMAFETIRGRMNSIKEEQADEYCAPFSLEKTIFILSATVRR